MLTSISEHLPLENKEQENTLQAPLPLATDQSPLHFFPLTPLCHTTFSPQSTPTSILRHHPTETALSRLISRLPILIANVSSCLGFTMAFDTADRPCWASRRCPLARLPSASVAPCHESATSETDKHVCAFPQCQN